MTLTLTLGHVVALTTGGTVAAILMGILSSARVQEASARAKIQEARANSRGLRLAEFQGHYHALQVHHRETLELQHEIQTHLKQEVKDARLIASLEKACNEQLRDEIPILNQAVCKIPELHEELAKWAGLGRRLQSWLAGSDGQLGEDRGRLPAPQFEELEGLLSDLDVLLRKSDLDSPQFRSIEEATSDEEAGPEDDTREVAAVQT